MNALVLEEYMKLTYREVPDPVPGPEEVLVRVQAVGICGSDIHGMDGSSGRRIPPLIMGHEAAGIIEGTGRGAGDWKRGDRVTFDSTVYDPGDWYSLRGYYNLSDNRKVLGVSTPDFKLDGACAEYVVVPRHILCRIPERVSFTQAAMTEPVAVALHAINLTDFSPEDTAVVVGSGMIGLFLIQLLKIRGIDRIVAVDIEPGRLEKALELGAATVINPGQEDAGKAVRSITGGRGADIGFEAVGTTETIETAINCIRRGASLTLVGNITPRVEIPLQAVVSGQLKLQGSCAINGEFPEVLRLMDEGRINTAALLSAEAPLSEGAAWFDRLYRKEKGLVKVVLIP
jgi:L-iditol 2-dehydrogenase